MKIAVIGWGSPIWNAGSLRLASTWNPDGPVLPLEFARISGGRRLTMVLHPTGPEIRTLWALSAFDDLTPAMKNLRQREKTVPNRIHFATSESDAKQPKAEDPTVGRVRDWLRTHDGLDAAIWLATAANFEKRRGVEFSPEEAHAYLAELEEQGLHLNAAEHLRSVPKQCRTELWHRLMEKRDW